VNTKDVAASPSHTIGAPDIRNLDWNLVRSFLAVAETGSLTGAAEQLASSQPTLSRQVASFEAAAGAALFERTARGLRLTGAGEALLEPARQIQAAFNALTLAAAGRDEQTQGSVRITASEMMSAYVLPDILVRLRALHPQIQIDLVASNRVDNLLEREADIALRMVEPDQGALIARRIGAFPLAFYARRDYLARRGRPSLHGPAGHDWIGYDRSPVLIHGFRGAGFDITREFFAFRTDNHIVGWNAVLSGLGIGIAMRCVGDLSPEVERVLPELPLPELPIWLTAHRELRDTPRIRIVFDFLAEALSACIGPAPRAV